MIDNDFSGASGVTLSAEQRLALSRAAIARLLSNASDEANQEDARSDGQERKSSPGFGLSWLKKWWTRHPWRAAVSTAGEIVEPVVQEIALREPFALLGGAALAGALLVWSKPWRLLSTTALLGTLIGGLSGASRPDAARGLLSLARFALRKR